MNKPYKTEGWSDLRRRGFSETPHDGRLGVIDIGSNSIRLVVYDAIKRTPLPLFNEKIFCGLGKGLAITGKLNPQGIKQAEACIKRFLALVHIMDVVELQIIATAAVRDAQDGAAFVENLERQNRISITVISGKKEAQLAAAGVFSSIYKPVGLAGDLGGGSIELIGIEDGQINDQTTLPIGPLRLLDMSEGDKGKAGKIIKEAFEQEHWLEKLHPPHFYAIGGSFRALAHIYMALEKYPLEIVHNYTVKTSTMRKFLKEIMDTKPEDLAKLPGAPSKRIDALIPAAQVMDRILDITEPLDVIFSASGIREGYLYEKLSPYLRSEDPLIASCLDLASQNGRAPGFAHELFEWTSGLFKQENEAASRLRFAVCVLSEIAWRIHPEYRAQWAFYRIIQSTLTGLSHTERAMLALALYHRYQFKLKLDAAPLQLLKEKERAWARLVGASTSLAFQLSGGMVGNLKDVELSVGRGAVETKFSELAKSLLSATVQKRIDNLSEAYEAYTKINK